MSRKYTKEFKESIVKMMQDGADAHNLSQEYGPHYQIILKWISNNRYENNPDEQYVKRLKKQNKKLKEENEILKAATVIMGKNNSYSRNGIIKTSGLPHNDYFTSFKVI